MTYKLTFPRRVIATAWSRELHIDHQPIEDVRLIDVLSRKQENWTLRLVANGRLVQDEGFQNRQEAFLTVSYNVVANSFAPFSDSTPTSFHLYTSTCFTDH